MKRKMKSFMLLLTFAFAFVLVQRLEAKAATTISPEVSKSGSANNKKYKETLPANETNTTYPLVIKEAGGYGISVSMAGKPYYVQAGIYKDEAGTDKVVASSNDIELLGIQNEFVLNAYLEPGTYYLQLGRGNKAPATNVEIEVWGYSSQDKDITGDAGKYRDSYGKDKKTIIYHKIVVPKTGYLKVNGLAFEDEETTVNNVVLYDSQKKALTKAMSAYSNSVRTVYYGVEKGTYYVGVKQEGAYGIKYSFTSLKDKNISSKKKAAALKKGKTVKGLMVAGEPGDKADYYKFKVSKRQKVSLVIKPRSTGALKFEILAAGKKGNVFSKQYKFNKKRSTMNVSKNLEKGTYYLKVSKSKNKKTTIGYYSVKWK